ncbi:hypothetical protein [Microbacterium sp. JZ37]|uniref:hypothetical protein n=1 Tax=Microbacterium sp. JZ37 TaxID=2654193 RepID=UPI002B45A7A2|nr:hypothetical protein [Microbacterium sp. JZ37]WRH18376.1 hypothetical protein GC092_13185 [Microbacterium sp. JZ37]
MAWAPLNDSKDDNGRTPIHLVVDLRELGGNNEHLDAPVASVGRLGAWIVISPVASLGARLMWMIDMARALS